MERAGKTALVLEFDYAQNLPLPKLPADDQFHKCLFSMEILSTSITARCLSAGILPLVCNAKFFISFMMKCISLYEHILSV